MDYVWVGVGGFIGANARFGLGRYVTARVGDAFPWGTMTINLIGSLLIGIIMTMLTERFVADPAVRLVLVVGVLGGFTTFSSYTWEAMSLFDQGKWAQAFAYGVGSNALGLAACGIGMLLARNVPT